VESGTTASGPAAPAKPIGPTVPTDKDYDPEELKKADAFKGKGNDFFKGKCGILIDFFWFYQDCFNH